MRYNLPQSLEINGKRYKIRTEYRAILDIIQALDDHDLPVEARYYVALKIFYVDFKELPQTDYAEAVRSCFSFINMGAEESDEKSPRLVDWDKDFNFIVAPVNQIIGYDVRSEATTHWWSFLSAYNEIGESTFAQIVHIRDQKARGKKLDKNDSDWYRRNRKLVDIETKYTDAEKQFLETWGGNNG